MTDPRSLTCWKKMMGEGKWSAQVACNRSKVTYNLEDEEEREEMISSDCMQQIQGHLHSGRWREERGNDQLRLHVTDPKSLTSWKIMRREGKSSAQVACDRSKVTYTLENKEERGEIISSGCMWQIQGHLHAGTWKEERGNDQLRSYATEPRSLTRWKMKRREGKWSAQVTYNRSKVTYTLEDEEERGEMISSGCMWQIQGHLQSEERGKIISSGHMWQIQGHLHAGRYREERGNDQLRSHVRDPRSLTIWGERKWSAQVICERSTSLTYWKMKRREGKWSAQVTCDRSKVTYPLEDEEEREEIISSGHM